VSQDNFQHCFITGGSSGLGKALAVLLAKMGAHVTIVARSETKLKEAVDDIKVYFTRCIIPRHILTIINLESSHFRISSYLLYLCRRRQRKTGCRYHFKGHRYRWKRAILRLYLCWLVSSWSLRRPNLG
jgi:hypothetical protein